MHRKPSIASATFFLLTALALIAAAGLPPHASAGRPANSPPTPPKVVTVQIKDFSFQPETVTVDAGDTVEWKNEEMIPHTATATGGAKPAFNSGSIKPGASWRYVANKKGTFSYFCTLHPNMKGKLIVK